MAYTSKGAVLISHAVNKAMANGSPVITEQRPLSNYVIKLYDRTNGDNQWFVQTDNIVAETKRVMKTNGIRVKTYEMKTYPGMRPTYHEWTCTKGIDVVAHEIYV